ncbi:MAG: sugar ABC transporter permease [Acholeplasmataceae bacterium]|nr:sugar ABC transporter permease [Acholeplasmataceae bacterium]
MKIIHSENQRFLHLRKRVLNQKTIPFLLLLPTILYYIVFWMSPILISIKEVFTNLDGSFTLLGNFKLMFAQQEFSPALLNTAFFATISVLLQFFVALVLAVLLSRRFTGQKLILFLIMIPMAITPTAVAIIWKTGLISQGWINSLLQVFNITQENILFLGLRGLDAVMMIILIDSWTVMPSVMIILIAGLGNIPKETKEAALTFGASKYQVLRDITLPQLKPSIITAIILRMIAAIQVWAIVVMILGFSNVPFLVERIAYYVGPNYGLSYARKFAYGYSFITALIVFVATMVYFKWAKRGSAFDRGTQK